MLGPLARLRCLAAFAVASLGCGDTTEPPPGDDAASTAAATSTSTATSSATSSSTETSSASDASTTPGTSAAVDSSSSGSDLPTCEVGSHQCEEGEYCSQFDSMSPGHCQPIPEGSCTDQLPCPEGFTCQEGSHHSELGECNPIETDTDTDASSSSSG